MLCHSYCSNCSSYHTLELGIERCPECKGTLIMLDLVEDKEEEGK